MRAGAARRTASAVVLTCASMLGACGGMSSGGGAATTPAVSTAKTSSHATAPVRLNFVVPKKTASAKARSTQYVSTSTTSLTITITPSGGTALAPIYVACTATCAASFQAPVGSDGIALKLTDGVNGSGNQLSLSTTTVTVVQNATNQFNLTANPVVSSVAVLLGAMPAATANTSGGTAADVPVTVNAMDADGNTIVGPGSYIDVHGNPVTLTLSVTNTQAGGNGTVALNGTTTFTSPSGTTTAHYDGKWLQSAAINVSSSSTAVSSVSGATLTTIPTAYENIVTGLSNPYAITNGPDGALWFTVNGADTIGRVTTGGVYSSFPVANAPNSITAGPDGNFWIADNNAFAIEKLTPGGVDGSFATTGTTDNTAVGPDGNIWYSQDATTISKITTGGSITPYAPAGYANVLGITAGPDGNMWFTDKSSPYVGRITTGGVATRFGPTSCTGGFDNWDITTGSDGNLWFTERSGGCIGRITPSGTLTEFSSGLGGAQPVLIVPGPDGALWFGEDGGDAIGRITTSGVITQYSTGITPGSSPQGLTFGPDHNIWFTEWNGGRVGKFVL